jgi:hypothetical protein
MIQRVLKMVDPLLLRIAQPVGDVDDPELSPLFADMTKPGFVEALFPDSGLAALETE